MVVSRKTRDVVLRIEGRTHQQIVEARQRDREARADLVGPLGGDHPARPLDHDGVAERLPQPGQRPANRRLADIELLGGSRRVARLEQGLQHPQGGEVEPAVMHILHYANPLNLFL